MTGTKESGIKTSQGGRGDPQKISPAAIEKYLKGIFYPASKSELIEQVKSNNAPDDVIYVLNNFSDRMYHSTVDVTKEIGHL